MITTEQVQEIIDNHIAGTDMFLVDLHIGVGNKISVELDSDSGLTIDKCKYASRAIEQSFDREVEDFELNVSSPGLDKPFRVHRQYVKNIGRNVKVKLATEGKVEGELIDVHEENIIVKVVTKERIEGKKKKETVETLHTIPFSDIKETKVVISF